MSRRAVTAGERLARDLRDRLPGWTMRMLDATAVDAAELRHPSYGWTVTLTDRAVATLHVAGRIVAELYALDAAPIAAMVDALERQHSAHRDQLAGRTLAEIEATERPRRPVYTYGGSVSGLASHLAGAA